MSLVDYPFDDDDDDDDDDDQAQEDVQGNVDRIISLSPSDVPSVSSPLSLSASNRSSQAEAGVSFASRSVEEIPSRLPDASELLASIGLSRNESPATAFPSRHAGGMGMGTLRKRPDLNGSMDVPHKKIPRGSLPPSRNVPDTAGGSLVPPQLRGRSNIATEDLDRLFIRRGK